MSERFARKPGGTQKDPAPTFKERFAAMANLPAFFKMVWETSPWMTLANILLRLSRASLPLAILYVGKLIIDRVVMLSKTHDTTGYAHLWQLVAAEFGLVILSDVLSRVIGLLDGLLGDLFANHTSVKIMRHAATLDLDQFEDSVFYDKLERARQQTVGRTMLLSQVLAPVKVST